MTNSSAFYLIANFLAELSQQLRHEKPVKRGDVITFELRDHRARNT